MIKKYLLLIISFSVLCYSCVNKKTKENVISQEPEPSPANENLSYETFYNGLIWYIEGAIKYYNNDTLTVYTKNTKESDSILTDYNNVFLINKDKTSNWFYLISTDSEIQGYVFIYDISEESFYGNLEGSGKNGPLYKSDLKTEREILKQYQNIKRYGPLLVINHNNKNIELWDSYNGRDGKLNLLFDYYPEYNEILIREHYWEGAQSFIYNLKYEEVRCALPMLPYFNASRTYLISFDWETYVVMDVILRIFKVNNGFYNEIYNTNMYLDTHHSINNIVWINDQEALIDCGEAGNVIVEINDEIKVTNNLVPYKWEEDD